VAKDPKMHAVGTMTWRSDLKALVVLVALAPFIFYAGYLHKEHKADEVQKEDQRTRQEIVDEALNNSPPYS